MVVLSLNQWVDGFEVEVELTEYHPFDVLDVCKRFAVLTKFL